MIVVASTAFNAQAENLCRVSVHEQEGGPYLHCYVNAAKQTPPKRATQNLHEVVSALESMDIVVCLDGDDWFSRPDALLRVQREYNEHPETLVTWGSYEHADGRMGCAAPWPTCERPCAPRGAPWVFSHLKTFRAGLFQRIKRADLMIGGEWIHRCVDMATMFPILEMARPDRARFIPDVLYTYNFKSSFEFNAPDADRRVEIEYARILRSRPAYERIGSL